MDTMQMYEFLWRPRTLDRRIQRLQLWRNELETSLLPGAIRYDSDRVQTSPEDRLPDVMSRVMEIDERILALKEEKAHAVLELGDAIEALDDEVQKTILSAFYVGRMPMDDVADLVGYSRAQAYRIRGEAIEKMRQMRQNNEV